jgi:hypothetical protein
MTLRLEVFGGIPSIREISAHGNHAQPTANRFMMIGASLERMDETGN